MGSGASGPVTRWAGQCSIAYATPVNAPLPVAVPLTVNGYWTTAIWRLDMKTISDYLNDYRAAKGIPSDYALARELGLTKQAISRYRHNAGAPDNDVCWRIAEGAGADYSAVVATAELARAQRTHDTGREKVWLERLQHVSASFSLAFVLLAASLPAVSGVQHCILCKIDTVQIGFFVSVKIQALKHRFKNIFSFQGACLC